MHKHTSFLARMASLSLIGLIFVCGVKTFQAQEIDRPFPAFDHSVFPVERAPNWGAMRSSKEWNRTYEELSDADFVDIPEYDLEQLTIPTMKLINPLTPKNIGALTAKLFYSTRHFGTYHLDSHEFAGVHVGIDLKLAEGTPVRAIGGGRIAAILHDPILGNTVMIEHRIELETYYSIYGHLDKIAVSTGVDVAPGDVIGTVGMTGKTAASHLHVQIDRRIPGEDVHVPFRTKVALNAKKAEKWTVHPLAFLQKYQMREITRNTPQ